MQSLAAGRVIVTRGRKWCKAVGYWVVIPFATPAIMSFRGLPRNLAGPLGGPRGDNANGITKGYWVGVRSDGQWQVHIL